MKAAGLTLQKTKEEKGPDAPNNLYAPIPDGPVGPQGSFSKEARSWSLYTWWATTPAVRWLGRGLVMAGLGALAWRRMGAQGKKPGFSQKLGFWR
jgi:hypothetical protein